MSNYIQVQKILQGIISKTEFENICQKFQYEDTARKLTAYVLFQYFLLSALLESKSFRELSFRGTNYGLPKVDYSTLSKKATAIPFEIYSAVFQSVFESCNRSQKRKIRNKYGRILKIIDSTRIIKDESQWSWAQYKDRKSGLKFHTAYLPDAGLPSQIVTSPICTGDSVVMEKFVENDTLLVFDRGYLNIEKMCKFDYIGQEFIVRMREGVNQLHEIDFDIAHDEKYQDHLCTLGKCRSIKSEYRNHQFRVINFYTDENKLISLCTNIMDLSADEIADIYRQRWGIECFFREFKQHFTIKAIFGKSPNSAFSQGIIAFICYLFTHCLYLAWKEFCPCKDTFLTFLRKLCYADLGCSLRNFCALFKAVFS